jgi:transposase InsO family protein
MRLTAEEKVEIIHLVDRADRPAREVLRELGIPPSSFYDWYRSFLTDGPDGLKPIRVGRRQRWNQIPEPQRKMVVDLALEFTDHSCRELACKITDETGLSISESSVYRILKAEGLITTPNHVLMEAGDKFTDQTTRVHEMWQTDFTYFKVIGWGWYYLQTILDDHSRYIVHWELCKGMEHQEVQKLVDEAITIAGLEDAGGRPRILSDNGPCYIAQELKQFLKKRSIRHVRGRPMHPQTQGKIERYHRSIKNVVKLDNYYCPEELCEAIASYVNFYNHFRYHESLDNVTPADVYYGRKESVLQRRREAKDKTMRERRLMYQKARLTG